MLKKHLVFYLMPNLAQAIASFGTVALLTRLLSDAEYGRFSLIFTIMTLVHYFVFTWAEAAAARNYAKAKEDKNIANHFATLLGVYLINVGIFVAVAIIVTLLYPAERAAKMALAAAFAGTIVRSALKIALETRRMDLQSKRFALVESFHIIAGLVLTVIGVWLLGYKEQGPFIALLVAAIMALLIEGPFLVALAKNGKFDKALAREYLAFGYPIGMGLILTMALNTGDRFLIAGYLGDAKVGIYSAGYQVAARILDIIFAWASSATFPLLVTAYEAGNKGAFAQSAKNSFALRLGIGAPCALGIALVAAPLCEILIGSSMRTAAIAIVPWIALAGLFTGVSDYFSDAFMLARKAKERMIIMLIPTILNIILNIILLPKLGINGAVIATVIAFAVGLLLLAILGRRHVALPIPWGETARIAGACLMMAIAVLLLPDFGGFFELLLKSIVGALVYGGVLIALNFNGARHKFQTYLRK